MYHWRRNPISEQESHMPRANAAPVVRQRVQMGGRMAAAMCFCVVQGASAQGALIANAIVPATNGVYVSSGAELWKGDIAVAAPELWTSDGTVAGTRLVKAFDLTPSRGWILNYLKEVAGTLYLSVQTGSAAL